MASKTNLYIVVVSYPYEGGWLVGVYDKKSTAKRIQSQKKAQRYPAEIIPCKLNRQILGNEKYI